MAETNQPASGKWKHELCSCTENMTDCLCAFFLTPCYNYTVAQAAGEEGACPILVCLCPVGMCCLRGTIREKRGIEGSLVDDCVCLYFCGLCSIVQMKREFTD